MKFELDNVKNYLEKWGFVYTIRKKRRISKLFPYIVETATHKGKKFAKIKIEEIGKVFKIGKDVYIKFNNGAKPSEDSNLFPLSIFVCHSGFKSEKQWIKAIINFYGCFPSNLYLYKVEIFKGV
mgnify:CR=1 FL=1